MRALHLLPCLVVFLGLSSPWAQAQNPPNAPEKSASTKVVPAERRIERQIENIRLEDSGSRIDEVRIGGETQSITVQPKGPMPAYEVVPNHGSRLPAALEQETAKGGMRVWKILGF